MKRFLLFSILSVVLSHPTMEARSTNGKAYPCVSDICLSAVPITFWSLPPDLCSISTTQFTNIEGTVPIVLTFNWFPSDSIAQLVNDLSALRIAGWNGTAWVNLGQTTTSGNLSAGSISIPALIPDTYSIYAFAAVCKASIADPCVCKNNATNLQNGQFDETIQVNAPANQTWAVTAVTGLYQTASPAPPSAPLPVPVGTLMTNVGGGVFELKGIHIDALGYTLTVSNGLGTTLSIGNTCAYPNPSISANLAGPFCLYSEAVPLIGIPGDSNIVSQGFTVNGAPATTFDPGAGLGNYTIVYTVDGGAPKASGPNDPGCIQTITQLVQVVATPSTLTCNNFVNISLDADCVSEIAASDLLNGTYPCYDDYEVTLDRVAPLGNGPWTTPIITIADVGKTYQARVTHLGSGNQCTSTVKIEDKLAPMLTCSDIALFCPINNYDPNYLKNTLNFPNAFPVVTDCSTYTLTYSDVWTDLPCGTGFNGMPDLSAYLIRKWTAKDAWNNSSVCIQYIYFKRLHIDDVLYPSDYQVACSANADTDPSVTGAPYLSKLGMNWSLYPDPGYCEMQAIYNDQYLPDCDGSYRILRTWTIVDFCLPITPFPPSQNPVYYTQLIKVLDTQGPSFVCPANLTVSIDPFQCCGIIDLPNVVLNDQCSRLQAISAMVTTFDVNTNQQTGMFTVGGTLTNFPGNNLNNPDTLGNLGFTPCLPLGNHTVVYSASDDCGNTQTCAFNLQVADLIPPVAVCDQLTQVSLGVNGTAVIPASTFDDGSYDNCGAVYFKVRRMGASNFSDDVSFSCSDVGSILTVVLRVYDVPVGVGSVGQTTQEDHASDCMVQVVVDDKIKPVCTAPANVTVSCAQFDPGLALYGNATVTDNCCLDNTKSYLGVKGLTHTINYSLFDTVCNKGTLVRNFTAFDCQGLSSQCTQRVVVNYVQDYFIRFPNDVIVNTCDGTGNYGAPVFFGEDCELLGVSFEDEVFTVVPDACFKIERSWTIINWCTYNPNLPCVIVPNPNPNNLANHPSNLPGPVVAPLGTPSPWAPTVVKVDPADVQTTNYSVFYNPNANCYQYKQLIKIVDTQDPVAQCPTTPVAFCDLTPNDPLLWHEAYWYDNSIASDDLCESEADLSITATDSCSGANISFRYLLFLDLDGDKIMETVVSSTNLPGVNNVQYGNAANANYLGGQPRAFDARPVPLNQQYRFGLDWTISGTQATAKVRFDQQQAPIALPTAGNNVLQGVAPQLPYGTHKIKWFIEDGCGNETICEYTFEIKDCKKPSVICLNGLTVNIMPTQMVQLWASDFFQYTDDNCTPASQLKIAVRKSSNPAQGFPVDVLGNPLTSVTFTCGELGTQQVQLWSMDKAGNADFCETFVIVQDNAQYCPAFNVAKVAGTLATELAGGVDEATVIIAGSSIPIPWFAFTTKTNPQGKYNFNAIPLATNSNVFPGKDDNPINGVSTYDLVLISKHILGLLPLDSPYKMIAADANNSNSITTFDIVELRKLILGIYSDLPTNTSWRFVDKSYVFPNPGNPFQTIFPEKKLIANLSGDVLNADFVSIKVGDVNNSSIPNVQAIPEDRSEGTLYLDLEDQIVTPGAIITIPLRASEVVAGLQFTFNYRGMTLLDLQPEGDMDLGNFGFPGHVGANLFTVSFYGNEKAAFRLTFQVQKAGRLRDLLHISSLVTRAEAYLFSSEQGSKLDVLPVPAAIALRFNQDKIYLNRGEGFEVYQNQPNPFSSQTTIGFQLPVADQVQLRIFDATGRVVHTRVADFDKGFNQFVVNLPDVQDSNHAGILYYRISTSKDSGAGTMSWVR